MRAPTTSWWWKLTPLPAEGPGLGLAHVVEQRGQARRLAVAATVVGHHRDGVGQDVLVAVDRVLLEAHGGQLGQELLGQAGLDQEPQPGGGVVDDQQLVELVADPLGRDDLQAPGHGPHRGHQLGVGLAGRTRR